MAGDTHRVASRRWRGNRRDSAHTCVVVSQPQHRHAPSWRRDRTRARPHMSVTVARMNRKFVGSTLKHRAASSGRPSTIRDERRELRRERPVRPAELDASDGRVDGRRGRCWGPSGRRKAGTTGHQRRDDRGHIPAPPIRATRRPRGRPDTCVEINQCVVWCSLSHFSTMTPPSWLGRAANPKSHAIEQVLRRWRGGRRDDSAPARDRKICVFTQPGTTPRHSSLKKPIFRQSP